MLARATIFLKYILYLFKDKLPLTQLDYYKKKTRIKKDKSTLGPYL
jgi:hypothetical protein